MASDSTTPRRIRVLLVNDYPTGGQGGAEQHVRRLESGLQQRGHVVSHFTRMAPRKRLLRALDFWDPLAARSLKRMANGFDVVHFHNFARELSPSVLRACRANATVLTIHDHRLFEPDRPPSVASSIGPLSGAIRRFDDALRTRAIRAISLVSLCLIRRHIGQTIAVSGQLQKLLRARGIDATIVPPFADPDPHAWSAPSGRKIAYVGRLTHAKGVGSLTTVMGSLPDAVLVVAGSGPDEEAIRASVPANAIDRVLFVGTIGSDEVRDLMRQSRAVCVPSIAPEGFPLVVVEAMLVGRPVICTDHPSMVSMLDDGHCGIVVRPGDTAGLREAISTVLSDDRLAHDLGMRARTFASKRYDTETALDQLLAIYETQLLGVRETVTA